MQNFRVNKYKQMFIFRIDHLCKKKYSFATYYSKNYYF